jgi:hypothetical protein
MKTGDLRPGDRIIYDGYPPAIPMRLAGTRGTIKSVNRVGNLVTVADEDSYGTRTIRPAWVRRVERDGKWVRPDLPNKPAFYG